MPLSAPRELHGTHPSLFDHRFDPGRPADADHVVVGLQRHPACFSVGHHIAGFVSLDAVAVLAGEIGQISAQSPGLAAAVRNLRQFQKNFDPRFFHRHPPFPSFGVN